MFLDSLLCGMVAGGVQEQAPTSTDLGMMEALSHEPEPTCLHLCSLMLEGGSPGGQSWDTRRLQDEVPLKPSFQENQYLA